jgi:TrmH family RNA methyltransferase
MLSKNQIKQINALSQKKQRDEQSVFVAEGPKLVGDLLKSFRCKELFYVSGCELDTSNSTNKQLVTADELKKISSLVTPQQCLAVFEKPNFVIDFNVFETELSLVLDDVQDPGNLGTIIRIADWFGIKNIFCSLHTADVYNPKTIQATMGALAKVKIHYVDIVEFLKQLPKNIAVYGTFMDGTDIYAQDLENKGLIIMGNEGKGIQAVCEQYVNKRLFIPDFPRGEAGSESLNVAVATAIVCAEFRRRNYSI